MFPGPLIHDHTSLNRFRVGGWRDNKYAYIHPSYILTACPFHVASRLRETEERETHTQKLVCVGDSLDEKAFGPSPTDLCCLSTFLLSLFFGVGYKLPQAATVVSNDSPET